MNIRQTQNDPKGVNEPNLRARRHQIARIGGFKSLNNQSVLVIEFRGAKH